MQHREYVRTDGLQQSIGPVHFLARGVLIVNKTTVDAVFFDDAGNEYDCPSRVAVTLPLNIPTSRMLGKTVAALPVSDTGSLSITIVDTPAILSTSQLATISLSGTPVKILHNHAVVASEPGIDFIDAQGLAFTIADDPANSRVTVAPARRIITGQISAAGAILAGTGFTCVRVPTGLYNITFLVPFAATPCVQVSCKYIGSNSWPQYVAPTVNGFGIQVLNNALNGTDDEVMFIATDMT